MKALVKQIKQFKLTNKLQKLNFGIQFVASLAYLMEIWDPNLSKSTTFFAIKRQGYRDNGFRIDITPDRKI